ncbi:hypothetical protein RU96_GL002455 [Enterococcus canintestini]|uniref:Uncharacterized protein n=1 Tax=Enterococcus canintestini TaxID=317010 RepID=A0A1L8R639_9ENTE|nr:hypothetical protein RU96_GL002455 [Enterococcus canintestini]
MNVNDFHSDIKGLYMNKKMHKRKKQALLRLFLNSLMSCVGN